MSTINIVKNQDLELWTESFGDNSNPPLLLIMGSGGQGVLWPVEFCEQLVQKGFFVIRYDHRDTGLSTAFNFFTQPYTLLDMANDAIHILDHYGIEKAHIVGASLGGAVAMLLGAHHADRVRSLTLMVTTIDMRPCLDAFQGLNRNHSLPGPNASVLAAAREYILNPPTTLEEKIEVHIKGAQINGGSIPIDTELCRELATLAFTRTDKQDSAFNHIQAIIRSHELHAAAPSKITAVTHIIHGADDPLFPVAHGEATHAAIAGSTLSIIPGMGHNFANRQLFEPLINEIVSCTARSS